MPRMLMITSVALALAWGGFACASPRDREQQALLKKAEMAAEQGLADAQYSLGRMYAEGHGVLEDPVEAHMWLSLSAGAEFNAARRALLELERRLTAEQIDLAEAIAREWLAARDPEEVEDD